MFHLISYKQGCHIVLISKICYYFEILLHVLENIPVSHGQLTLMTSGSFRWPCKINKHCLSVCLADSFHHRQVHRSAGHSLSCFKPRGCWNDDGCWRCLRRFVILPNCVKCDRKQDRIGAFFLCDILYTKHLLRKSYTEGFVWYVNLWDILTLGMSKFPNSHQPCSVGF